jgi:hypothetical protein
MFIMNAINRVNFGFQYFSQRAPLSTSSAFGMALEGHATEPLRAGLVAAHGAIAGIDAVRVV